MNTKTLLCTCTSMLALPLATQAATFLIPEANLDSLDGETSKFFVISVTDNGVTADLTFTFTATGGTFDSDTGGRFGITSANDVGISDAIETGESMNLTVSSNVTSGPGAGLSITSLDFGIPEWAMFRFEPTGGAATYTWASSAATHTSTSNNVFGAQPDNEFDGASLFDINSGTYSATFTSATAGSTGYRLQSNADQPFTFTANVAPVPEPSSTALLGLGALGLVLRRKRER